VLAIGVLIVAILGVLLWLLLRPRPQVPLPPAVQARQSLDALREQPADGQLLSRVSQVVRRYFTDAFSLGSGEMTTSEIASALAENPSATPQLADSVAGFLRSCDERKFKQNAACGPVDAVPRAVSLIEQAEVRRDQVHAAGEAAASQTRPATA
jgi:hypothetical protein